VIAIGSNIIVSGQATWRSRRWRQAANRHADLPDSRDVWVMALGHTTDDAG
jgi:hypothetical protein